MIKINFAFLVHSRDRRDLPRKFPLLRFLPVKLFDLLTLHLPPFVVSRITGMKDNKSNLIDGIIIGIPMTAHQMIENRVLASKRVVQATKLAKKRGANFVGLGAMTASMTRGGRDVVENVNDVCITTGRTYTTKNITEYVDYCISRFNLKKETVRIGIVGAAGGIGSGTTILLAKKQYRNFVLVDLERKLDNLKKKIEVLEKNHINSKIVVSHLVSSIIDCDIVIAATNAPEVIIKSADVSPGTIIINDAQPSDVSPEILNNRSDVMVIEGGVLTTPNINCHFNLGLSQKTDIFSCLAETLLLAHRGSDKHYSIDDFDHDLLNKLDEDGIVNGFKIGDPQNDRGHIPKQFIDEFARIIERKKYN